VGSGGLSADGPASMTVGGSSEASAPPEVGSSVASFDDNVDGLDDEPLRALDGAFSDLALEAGASEGVVSDLDTGAFAEDALDTTAPFSGAVVGAFLGFSGSLLGAFDEQDDGECESESTSHGVCDVDPFPFG
jgi:hypothetical protein